MVVELPERFGPSGEVRAMALSAWSIREPLASAQGRPPGMGVKFFMMTAEDKNRWDRFYLELQRAREPDSARNRVVSSRNGPPKFYLRPRDFLQMFRFQKHSLGGGTFFLRSPYVVDKGRYVQVVVIHPDSKEEFPLTGRVERVVADGPVPLRGMSLRWCNVVMATHEDFYRFVVDGIHPIQAVDLRLAG